MTELTSVNPEPVRDRWGRPLVVPPTGGKAIPYTRATTVAETIDDRYNLELWKCRMTGLGLADRPDLLLAFTTHRDDKKKLNGLVDKAIEAAKGTAGATTGTALHKLTEAVDRGEQLPTVPAEAAASLDVYRKVMEPFTVLAIEQFLVLDEHQVAGTADRIVEYDGTRYIFDLKTGSTVDFSMGAIAQQLAIYSRGLAYDIDTGTRTETGVDQDAAIVCHMPAGQGTCDLYWVNIAHGWEAALISLRVRAYRKHARNGLSQPFRPATSSEVA